MIYELIKERNKVKSYEESNKVKLREGHGKLEETTADALFESNNSLVTSFEWTGYLMGIHGMPAENDNVEKVIQFLDKKIEENQNDIEELSAIRAYISEKNSLTMDINLRCQVIIVGRSSEKYNRENGIGTGTKKE